MRQFISIFGAKRRKVFYCINTFVTKAKEVVSEAIIAELFPCKDFVKTITSDNGKEFAKHQIIGQRLEADYYFAHLYHSWERGSNENFNGVLRQYVPKKEIIITIPMKKNKKIQNKSNNRPEKNLILRTNKCI